MKFLLDTVALSELRKGPKTIEALRSWSNDNPLSDVATSVICLMELRYGAFSVRNKDPVFADRRWVSTIETDYAGRILPVDRAVAFR